MTEVRAEGLTKSFAGSAALESLDLTLAAGKITVLLGPSGCGKTTFLRILAGLAEPDGGRVTIGDRVVNDPKSRVPPEKRGIGMVFQDALLWPHMTIRRNIAFPLGAAGKADPRVEEAAKAAEVARFLDRYPSELSGGERQRAAVARAIVSGPRLLLLDEPLTGLDANLRVRLLRTIRRVQRSLGVTACYVTHDQEEALGLADHIVVMRAGKVLQAGGPEEIYARPRSAFVAGFVGLSNLVEGECADGGVETELGRFPVGDRPGNRILFAARPETVRLDSEDGVAGEVAGSTFLGDRWLVTVKVGEREVLARSDRKREVGETVRIRVEPDPVPVEDDRT